MKSPPPLLKVTLESFQRNLYLNSGMQFVYNFIFCKNSGKNRVKGTFI